MDIMKSEHKVFGEVRGVVIEGKPHLVGVDVCRALGYTNSRKAMKDHCRGVTNRYPIVDALGRTQEVRALPEGDVFRLIMKSKMPKAREFEGWVMDEVLPTIRKSGGYLSPTVDWSDLDNIQRVLDVAKDERKRRLIAEDRLDFIEHSGESYTSTNAALRVGFTSANALHKDLKDRGILKRIGQTWMPTSACADKLQGCIVIKRPRSDAPYTKAWLKWTASGMEWLVELYGVDTMEEKHRSFTM